MTDDRLRRLEREAITGGLDARARWLTERTRVGELAEDRLRLAAWLGDPAAEQALGRAVLAPPTITIGRWVRGLVPWQTETPWAREAFARAAAAAARAVLACFDDGALATRAVVALEAWIRCPCDEHAQAAAALGGQVPIQRGAAGLFAARGVRFAGPAIYRATTVALSEGPANVTASEVATEAARATSPEAVRAAIRDALVPWALLEGDPLG